LTNLKKNFETLRKDRFRDHHKLEEMETKLQLQKNQLDEYKRVLNSNINLRDNLGNKNQNSVKSIQKKIEPAKKSVDRSLKKFRKSFDLKDINNVKFIESIHYKIHN
jgi:hypothetical protein